MLYVRADQPVDPLVVEVLRQIDGVARELSLPFFVAGAMARDILLTNVFGIQTTRATRDIDLAVALESWQQFNAFKERVAATGRFVIDDRAMQRIYYTGGNEGSAYPVDLLPFGGVQQDDFIIAWPPDMKVVMNVAGYQEALASAVPVLIEPNLTVPIASLPSLALLKLFAWLDRRNETPQDAQDFVILCRRYEEAGNRDRLYGTEIATLEAVDYDLELASPRLLGQDARAIANEATLERADTLLNESQTVDRLLSDMAIELPAADDSIAEAQKLLNEFKTGLLGK
jgi:predicted nucleotidyltransferase